MNTIKIPPLDEYLSAKPGASLSTAEQSVLNNLRWEERVGDARLNRYGQAYEGKAIHSLNDISSAQQRYAEEHIEIDVTEPNSPDTFSPDNAANAWRHIQDSLYLLRIEDARFALENSGLDIAELETAMVKRDDTVLERLCAQWNRRRDRRPAFATTEIAVDDLLDEAGDDWPHALRDHLGLGPYNPGPGSEPIPVLLMRYTVAEVQRDKSAGFAIPTMIDGRLNPFFFPTPIPADGSEATAYEVGRALNLAPVATESEYRMGLEIVHSRVEYRPEHFWRIGRIARSWSGDQGALRGLHLAWLRLETDRPDFGA